jgi:hypothetical protein
VISFFHGVVPSSHLAEFILIPVTHPPPNLRHHLSKITFHPPSSLNIPLHLTFPTAHPRVRNEVERESGKARSAAFRPEKNFLVLHAACHDFFTLQLQKLLFRLVIYNFTLTAPTKSTDTLHSWLSGSVSGTSVHAGPYQTLFIDG